MKGNRQAVKDVNVLIEMQQMGIPVFPCGLRMVESPNGKPTEVGHPKGWPDTKPEQYDLRTASLSGAFCVVTGHGVDVLDVDPRNGGDVGAVLKALREYRVPVIGIVDTPGGGIHVYLRSIKTALPGRMRKGIDFLAKGQMAYAPPTIRPKYSGVRYQWQEPPNLARIDGGTGRTRRFLLYLTVHEEPGTKAGSAPAGLGNVSNLNEAVMLVRASTPGSRNKTLFTVVARLVGLGLWDDEVSNRIRRAAVRVGLPESEALLSIDSGVKLGQKRRDDAQEWAMAARSNLHLPRRNATSMQNTITDLQGRFTAHGSQGLGLSCRELAEAINASHYTASKNLRDLTSAGLLVRESSTSTPGHSDRYSMPEDGKTARGRGKVDSQTDTYRSTYENPPVECQPSPVLAERLRQVSCHSAFARDRGRSGLPPKVAETLVALEDGATTAQEVHDRISISIDTVLTHFKILESASLVSRHRVERRVHVTPLWGTDLLAALDDWAAAMGIDDMADRRRSKHQAQREYFRKWGTERTGGRTGRQKTSTRRTGGRKESATPVIRRWKRP